MSKEGEIVNRVSKSRTKLLDLEELYPHGERIAFDLAPFLYEGLALREKDFRESMENHDWEQYNGAHVALFCSADAIVPAWAYMLVASKLSDRAKTVCFGFPEELENMIFEELIAGMDMTEYEDQRVIIKGCSKLPVPVHAYVRLSQKLSRTAKAVMFGEPCSTVPVFKKSRK